MVKKVEKEKHVPFTKEEVRVLKEFAATLMVAVAEEVAPVEEVV